MKLFQFIASLLLILSNLVELKAQEEWQVPEDKKARLSPHQFTDSTIARGKEIFNTNCISCHGDPGKSNYNRTLIPVPGDPAASKFQLNTDGAMYYKITEGRVTMPSFKDILSQNEIWDVISYVRSYNKDYVQQVAEKISELAYKGKLNIKFSLVDETKIKATVEGNSDGKNEPIAGAELKLFAKRWFGNLAIDDSKTTNTDGSVIFDLPSNLPGDSLGRINFIAQMANQELYNSFKADTVLAVGLVVDKPSLRAQRAMWNTVRMAPWWVIITYSLGVLAAWGVIFYILLQLRTIFYIGKQNE